MHRLFLVSLVRSVLLCSLPALAGTSDAADLTEFCLAERPKVDDKLAALWDERCPSIHDQLTQSALESAELDLEKKELENAKLTADLIEPLSPTTDKADVTAFAIEAQQQDAALTFAVARKIGSELRSTPMCPGPGQLSPPGPRVPGGPVRFTWDQVPGANGYVFSLWDVLSGKSVTSTTGPGSTEATATLDVNGKFAWTVTSCGPTGCSLAAPLMYVHTGAEIAPANGVPQVQASSHCSITPLLLVTGTERSSLIGSVSSEVLTTEIKNHTDSISKLECTKVPGTEGGEKVVFSGAEIVAIASSLKLLVSAASYFQPQVLAAAAVSKISEPQPLIAAGIASGLGQGRWDLRLHEPSIGADNPVLAAVKALREALTDRADALERCSPEDKAAKEGRELLKKTDEYLGSILKAEAGARSAVAVAAREAALRDAGIRHTLLISRDVGGGTAALVKPTGFSSIRVLSAAGVVLSYQLVNLDSGAPVAAGCKSAIESKNTKSSKWPGDKSQLKADVQDCVIPDIASIPP